MELLAQKRELLCQKSEFLEIPLVCQIPIIGKKITFLYPFLLLTISLLFSTKTTSKFLHLFSKNIFPKPTTTRNSNSLPISSSITKPHCSFLSKSRMCKHNRSKNKIRIHSTAKTHIFIRNILRSLSFAKDMSYGDVCAYAVVANLKLN